MNRIFFGLSLLAALVAGCGSDDEDGSRFVANPAESAVASYSGISSTQSSASSMSTGATGNTSTSSTSTSSTSSNSTTASVTTSSASGGNSAAIPVPGSLPTVVGALPVVFPGAFFDDFFSDNVGQPAANFNNFIQWVVSDGTVDLTGGNVPGAQGGRPFGRFVNLGGSSGNPGRFATVRPILFNAGVTYTFSFAYLSTDAQAHTATATLAEQSYSVTTSDPTQYSVFSANFTPSQTSTTPLVFQDQGNGQGGIGVDFIFVRPAVPLI